MFDFKPTEQQEKDFDSFLQREFNDISRPKFRDEQERSNALKVWWWVESTNRQNQRKINAARLALHDLFGFN